MTRKNKTINYKDPLAVTPSRKDRPSILSGESSNQNFRGTFFKKNIFFFDEFFIGFINLGIIVLFIINFRLILENFLKYGFLIKVFLLNDFSRRKKKLK